MGVLDETAAGQTASAETGAAGPSDYERADKISTSSEEFRNALELLNNCLKDENIEALKRIGENAIKDEDSIAVGVGLHLLEKLTGTCITNKKKGVSACPCGCRDKVPFSDNMCIGSSDTLHGELDMIAEGVAVNVAEKLPTDDDVDPVDGACGTDDDGFETDDEGRDTVEEGREERKRKYDRQLYQFLSQTIVFGWTEFNRHRELGPYIPSVFMVDKQFGFAVYNPITDCLVLGKDFIPFLGPESEHTETEFTGTKYAGIFILWLILHHRIFFRHEMDLDFECNFKQQTNVRKYEELKSYESSVRDNSVPFRFGTNLGLRIPKRKQLKSKHLETDSK